MLKIALTETEILFAFFRQKDCSERQETGVEKSINIDASEKIIFVYAKSYLPHFPMEQALIL